MSVWYLDSSAIVRLAVVERETHALLRWRQALPDGDELVTCELAVAEVLRAVSRVGGDTDVALAQLDALDHVVIDRDLLLAAGAIEPTVLRTLDALHLAAAETLGEELHGVVTYDDRMAAAARARGHPAVAPGL